MLKQNLSHKLLQRLSPQQIQLMKLLQIPTATLDQRIKEELEANPALEEGEDQQDSAENDKDDLYDTDHLTGATEAKENKEGETPNEDFKEAEAEKDDTYELDDYIKDYMDDDVASYKLNVNNYSADDEEKTIPIAVEGNFHDYLERQIGLLNLKEERLVQIAEQIVGSIDDDGYLRRDPVAIVDDLMFAQNILATPAEINDILKQIQGFDPAGVGARNLQECLELQLERKNSNDEDGLSYEQKAPIRLAYRIISDWFDEFSKKHYIKLQRHLNISEKQLKRAIAVILKLNPKPASGIIGNSNNRNTQYIVPDFIIINREGELDLTLNSRNAPELRISDQYRDMLSTYDKSTKEQKRKRSKKDAVMFIKQKIDSARWFIDAIRQRQHTMLKTMNAIMLLQYDFFLTGDQKKLKPMILKDVAEITGLDISTVSRVANSKYVQTEFGTKRLKSFFSESLQTSSGEEVSTLEVKKILKDIIADENKRRPLSDEKLKVLLQEKGYNIARRTVAKYREQLSIPVARLRKEL